jgi:hypothetical protein
LGIGGFIDSTDEEGLQHQTHQITLRNKIQKMVEGCKIDEVMNILKSNFGDLWKSNKTIECSLLSIKFIEFFKSNLMKEAIDLLQKPPLSSNQLSCSWHNLSYNESPENN